MLPDQKPDVTTESLVEMFAMTILAQLALYVPNPGLQGVGSHEGKFGGASTNAASCREVCDRRDRGSGCYSTT